MNRTTRISMLVIAVAVAVAGVLIALARADNSPPPAEVPTGDGAVAEGSPLVRPDSHRLTDVPGGKVTVVEFLDLECEACRAAFPGVEQLRGEYSDRVTFVVRYFPIPSHHNAELAARAVEAASRQGRFEQMYQTMYETQSSWGERMDSQREAFVGFAADLGLDVKRFQQDLDDPELIERVLADRADGMELGVRGTPTFFINGARFLGAPTYDGLKRAIDAALTE